MKVLLLTLGAFFSLQAGAAELASIDCLGSNGVLIQGASNRGEAMRVSSRWGYFRKEFTASVVKGSDGVQIRLDGDNDTGSYLIALDANPLRRLTQKTRGSILSISEVRGIQPTFLAFVSCDVRFR